MDIILNTYKYPMEILISLISPPQRAPFCYITTIHTQGLRMKIVGSHRVADYSSCQSETRPNDRHSWMPRSVTKQLQSSKFLAVLAPLAICLCVQLSKIDEMCASVLVSILIIMAEPVYYVKHALKMKGFMHIPL